MRKASPEASLAGSNYQGDLLFGMRQVREIRKGDGEGKR